MSYSLDAVDKKLLLLLIHNSRQSITQLAKKARISRDIAHYRIDQLHKRGIIRDFITNIDQERLGYISALFFVSINTTVEKDFIEYISSLDFISWAGTHLGFWSLGMAIYGRNTREIEERFQEINQKYKDHIGKHRFTFYKKTEFYTEKYFGAELDQKKHRYEEHKVDTYDKTILKLMAKNARIKTTELAKYVPLTSVAIAQRIAKLEKSGIIQSYSIYVNVFKINLYLFIFFIQNRDLEQRKKLFSYLRNHPKVSLLLDYIGDPFVEFGLFVEDPYEARPLIQEIKEAFPDNELIDFFLTQEDFVSYGAPRCVFE